MQGYLNMTFLPKTTGPITYKIFCGGLFSLSDNQRDEVFKYLEQKRSKYRDNPTMLYEYLKKGAIVKTTTPGKD